MKITISGSGEYRTFQFPGDLFGNVFPKMIAIIGSNQEGDRFAGDLSNQARKLGKAIVNLGGIHKVVFHETPSSMDVWVHDARQWNSGILCGQIEDLILQHFPEGRLPDYEFELFGIHIVIPR